MTAPGSPSSPVDGAAQQPHRYNPPFPGELCIDCGQGHDAPPITGGMVPDEPSANADQAPCENEHDLPDVQSPMSRRRDLDGSSAESAGSSPVGEPS